MSSFLPSEEGKAAVMLFALAVFLAGSCIRAACAYAAILRAPAEYVCTAPDGFRTILPKLAENERVRGYSMQTTAALTAQEHTLNVTGLSPAYLLDCCGIEAPFHTIFANEAAWTAFGLDAAEQSAQVRGTLGGKPFSGELIREDLLPDGQPAAVMAVTAAELHDAAELRVCMTEPDPDLLGQLGLQIMNPEAQTASEYEKQLVLLRIRFGALSALLAVIAAGAFLRVGSARIHADTQEDKQNRSPNAAENAER